MPQAIRTPGQWTSAQAPVGRALLRDAENDTYGNVGLELGARVRQGGTMDATATTAPGRDSGAAPQHLVALRHANRVRLARADLKRRIGTGELTVGEVVLNVPEEATSMTMADLLRSQKRWGEARCRRLLSAIPLTETKTVGALTDRQRRAVACALAQAEAPAERLPALAQTV